MFVVIQRSETSECNWTLSDHGKAHDLFNEVVVDLSWGTDIDPIVILAEVQEGENWYFDKKARKFYPGEGGSVLENHNLIQNVGGY